jgi:hypothetical protein
MVEIYKNVAAYNNGTTTTAGIYTVADAYAPCWFGITYVDCGGALDYPIEHPDNEDTLPSWVTSTTDLWDEPRNEWSKLDIADGAITCSS